MDFTKYLIENAYILIPVLYILGNVLKSLQFIPDKFIPVLLLGLGIILACFWLGFSTSSVIQGVLITGITVYSNQVFKQLLKNDNIVSDVISNITQDETVKSEVKTDSATISTVTDSAKTKLRVDDPENEVSDGAVVNATPSSSPTV